MDTEYGPSGQYGDEDAREAPESAPGGAAASGAHGWRPAGSPADAGWGKPPSAGMPAAPPPPPAPHPAWAEWQSAGRTAAPTHGPGPGYGPGGLGYQAGGPGYGPGGPGYGPGGPGYGPGGPGYGPGGPGYGPAFPAGLAGPGRHGKPGRHRGLIMAAAGTAVALAVGGTAWATIGSASASAPLSAATIASKTDPGLVDINTTIDYGQEAAAGTGMVLTSNGEVLTNNHVIEGATSI
jgi:hypothetical protein